MASKTQRLTPLCAIERFEASTNYKPFRKFHIEQARSFRARLAEETNAKNRPLSAATVTSTLRVRTKGRKTFTSIFFPVGSEPRGIVADYVVMLKVELGFSDDDPLFPSTQIGRGEDRGFVADGLSRIPWSGAGPIRRIFRTALAAADLLYTNPHSFRDTLVRLGQRICRTPEEWKVWSQNLGHENEATTFVGYGHVPTHRHAEIMQAFGTIRPDPLPAGLDIAALKAFVQSVEAISAS